MNALRGNLSWILIWVFSLILVPAFQNIASAQTQYIDICKTLVQETAPETEERLLAALKLTDAYFAYDLDKAWAQSKVAHDLAQLLDNKDAMSVCEMDQFLIQARRVGRALNEGDQTQPQINSNARAEYLAHYHESAVQYGVLRRPYQQSLIDHLVHHSQSVGRCNDKHLLVHQLLTTLLVRTVLKNGDLKRNSLSAAHKQLKILAGELNFADAKAVLHLIEARQQSTNPDNVEAFRLCLQKSLDEYRTSGNRLGQIQVLQMMTDHFMESESWEKCIELNKECLELATMHGSQLLVLKCYANLASFERKQGRLSDAQSLIQTALDLDYFKRQLTPAHVDIYNVAFGIACEQRDFDKIKEYAEFVSAPTLDHTNTNKALGRLVIRISKLKENMGEIIQNNEDAKQVMATQFATQQAKSKKAIQALTAVIASLSAVILLVALLIYKRRLGSTQRLLKLEQRNGHQGEKLRMGLELKLQRMARTESLGLLAGGIAHDFNNLLVGVLGNAEIAKSACDQDNVFLKQRIDGIMVAAEKAADLSRQMLAYTGKKLTNRTTVDLNLLLKNLTPIFQANDSNSIEYNIAFSRIRLISEIDQTQIEQVILNLVSNSSAASKIGGKIVIRTGTETIDEIGNDLLGKRRTGGKFNFIEIQDSGHGIDQEKIERIFDPFFSDNGAGRGLGLAVVYGMVSGHDGLIRINSRVGHGTVIRILIPDAKPTVSEDSIPVEWSFGAPSFDATQPTILIVDDERSVLDFTRHAIEHHGFNVIVAGGGRQGLQQLEQFQTEIDCILLDVVMPDLGAADFMAAMTALNFNNQIVLMSGYSPQQIAEFQCDSRVVGILEKPFPINELLGAITIAVAISKEQSEFSNNVPAM